MRVCILLLVFSGCDHVSADSPPSPRLTGETARNRCSGSQSMFAGSIAASAKFESEVLRGVWSHLIHSARSMPEAHIVMLFPAPAAIN